MIGIGRKIWREIGDDCPKPNPGFIGLFIWFGDIVIILNIIYSHWSWWWFPIPFLFLMGLFLIVLQLRLSLRR